MAHGVARVDDGWCDIDWLRPDGQSMQAGDWRDACSLCLLLTWHEEHHESSPVTLAAAIVFNTSDQVVNFKLAGLAGDAWQLQFHSSREAPQEASGVFSMEPLSLAMFTVAASSV